MASLICKIGNKKLIFAFIANIPMMSLLSRTNNEFVSIKND